MAQPYGPDQLRNDLGVSRETCEALEAHRRLLEAWAPRINLVGPKELGDYWRRHALDGAQLIELAPLAVRWMDLGTGAGFPGLIIAICLKDRPGAQVDLVEVSAKRVAFLREAVRATGAPARVLHIGAEEASERIDPQDVVTARAFAPLPRIMEFAKPIFDRGSIGLFPKGADYGAELAACAEQGWSLKVQALKSRSDPKGRILRVEGAARVQHPG
jgi:16S rRNA (guanine527-N7)-methyltransferase